MEKRTDVIVVGAGPAGLSAACAARDCGLAVTLIDEQSKPGGQLLRNVESPLTQAIMDPKERDMGLALVAEFRQSGTRYIPEATVWSIDGQRVSFSTPDGPQSMRAQKIILAPGGMERPVPFPGWTLPGVMGTGGADILLRSGGSLTADQSQPVVLCGNGPLLLLLACHLLDAGVNIVAWLDTGNMAQRMKALASIPASVLDLPYVAKGLRMASRILKGKIPIIRHATDIRAIGTDRLEKVTCRTDRTLREFPAAVLLRHEGIIPRTQICNALGVQLSWDTAQRCWYVATDRHGRTSLPHVYVAGDGAYVHGGDASLLKGRLAGVDAAAQIGVISQEEALSRTAAVRSQLKRLRVARNFLRHVFTPNPEIFKVPDSTLVCRCECVTAGAIRKATAEGFHDVMK